MLKLKALPVIGILLLLLGCTETVSQNRSSRILAMGDSLMAIHGLTNNAISDHVERNLGEPVLDKSVLGARMFYSLPISGSLGLNISKQYSPGQWDWIILNGGGNDLWLGCGCRFCDKTIERLISKQGGWGHIPTLIHNLRRTGAKIIYVGYLRSPGFGSPIEHCKDEGDELESRITKYVAKTDDVYFLSLADLVPKGDKSYHGVDRIHPSLKASRVIGGKIAQIIKQHSE